MKAKQAREIANAYRLAESERAAKLKAMRDSQFDSIVEDAIKRIHEIVQESAQRGSYQANIVNANIIGMSNTEWWKAIPIIRSRLQSEGFDTSVNASQDIICVTW